MQYRLNMAAAQWKARKLNEILPELQSEFETQLNRGTILELPASDSWVADLEELLA